MMTLEQMEKKATKKGNPIITQMINNVLFSVQRGIKSKCRKFSYKYGDCNMARDQAEEILK